MEEEAITYTAYLLLKEISQRNKSLNPISLKEITASGTKTHWYYWFKRNNAVKENGSIHLTEEGEKMLEKLENSPPPRRRKREKENSELVRISLKGFGSEFISNFTESQFFELTEKAVQIMKKKNEMPP